MVDFELAAAVAAAADSGAGWKTTKDLCGIARFQVERGEASTIVQSS
jgi:hypothetical protein